MKHNSSIKRLLKAGNKAFNISFIICFYSLLISCVQSKEKDQRPNIILISADDLGWSDIGCYGSEIQTPNLDKLGHGGMRFRQFHNTSKCFPSRACLLTGVYAQDCGYDKTYKNPIRNAVTLGEVLREAGYRTLWSGKHHGLENPYYRGFDRYYGLKDGACNYFNPGLQRKGEGIPAHKTTTIREWCIDSVFYKPYTPKEKDFYTTDYFTNYALQWLEEYKGEDKPFFLYMAYTAPHDPLMAWPEDIKKYKGWYDKGYEAIRQKRYGKQLEIGLLDDRFQLSSPTHTPWEKLGKWEQEEEAGKMEVYAAMIDRMDRNIGRILGKLRELGEEDNTLILFMSDNGASPEVVNLDTDDDTAPMGSITRWISLGENWANVCNTPFRYYKRYSYEGGINTPLIVRWPGKIEAKSISDFPGHFIDIMPTLIEVSGAKYPTDNKGEPVTPLRGESLLPAFRGKKEIRSQPLYWAWDKGKAMRMGNWKIVKQGEESSWDLYDMDKDVTETNNLSGELPGLVNRLDSIYNAWYVNY